MYSTWLLTISTFLCWEVTCAAKAADLFDNVESSFLWTKATLPQFPSSLDSDAPYSNPHLIPPSASIKSFAVSNNFGQSLPNIKGRNRTLETSYQIDHLKRNYRKVVHKGISNGGTGFPFGNGTNSLTNPEYMSMIQVITNDNQDASKKKSPSHRDKRDLYLYCPALPVTARTIVTCTNGKKVGSKCFLRCAPGFLLSGGRRSRKCRLHRRGMKRIHDDNPIPFWSGKQKNFHCVPICDIMKDPEHGKQHCAMVNLPTGKALQCTAECNRGYKISGSTKRTCMERSVWSGKPATCEVSNVRHSERPRFTFQAHQSVHCGEVNGLASYHKDGVIYLVAGDKSINLVRIFKWNNGKFDDTPVQTFHFPAPIKAEVLTAPDGRIWIMVYGAAPVTLYRLQSNGQFQRSHTTDIFSSLNENQDADTIGFAEFRGEFYRCYGRNKRETPVFVVDKLQEKPKSGSRDVFRRIMRKKLPGEKVLQCSLYTEGNSLYTIFTLNKPDGSGRIVIGHLTESRMKIVETISGPSLTRVSDIVGFSSGHDRFVVASQSKKDGRCIVYKRVWRNRMPVGTG